MVRSEPVDAGGRRRFAQSAAMPMAEAASTMATESGTEVLRLARWRACIRNGGGAWTTRMGDPFISAGIGMWKKRRTVGATSSFDTNPTRLVVSDVSVCIGPRPSSIVLVSPSAITIGVTSSLIRSMATVGAASSATTKHSGPRSRRTHFSSAFPSAPRAATTVSGQRRFAPGVAPRPVRCAATSRARWRSPAAHVDSPWASRTEARSPGVERPALADVRWAKSATRGRRAPRTCTCGGPLLRAPAPSVT